VVGGRGGSLAGEPAASLDFTDPLNDGLRGVLVAELLHTEVSVAE